MGKILVIGDSISYGKWADNGGWVSSLRSHVDKLYNLRKGGNLQVYNLGIPGEVVTRMVDRVKVELPMRVDTEDSMGNNVVIYAVGINDSCPNNWMTKRRTPEKEFKESITELVGLAKKYKCRVVFVGLTPIDPSRAKTLLFSDEHVRKYDKFISEICEKEEVLKLNIFDELLSDGYVKHLVDVVHPDSIGHELLYKKILSYLNKNKLIEYVSS